MLGQITEAVVSLFFLGLIVVMGVVLLNSLARLPLVWGWSEPRREREERVIIINNQPSLQAPPSGPGAGSILALALAGLLVALTRRVDSQALPAPTEPTDLPARYYDYRG